MTSSLIKKTLLFMRMLLKVHTPLLLKPNISDVRIPFMPWARLSKLPESKEECSLIKSWKSIKPNISYTSISKTSHLKCWHWVKSDKWWSNLKFYMKGNLTVFWQHKLLRNCKLSFPISLTNKQTLISSKFITKNLFISVLTVRIWSQLLPINTQKHLLLCHQRMLKFLSFPMRWLKIKSKRRKLLSSESSLRTLPNLNFMSNTDLSMSLLNKVFQKKLYITRFIMKQSNQFMRNSTLHQQKLTI